MIPHGDTNWWDFTIDINEREKKEAIIKGNGPVNPETSDGRFLLDYHRYIGLDQLLSCQVPSSRIPDERIFIITHQLFELVFKQMIFDLAVIAKTFEVLLSRDTKYFEYLCSQGETVKEVEEFWRPALHASGRLTHSSKKILPALLQYLDKKSSRDETDGSRVELFDSEEFKKFRDNLIPASGFQTAQFRLIGRALGKSNLFNVRVFPSWKFQKFYLGEGKGDGLPLTLVDPLILRNGEIIATPPTTSTLGTIARVDDLAHAVLARLATLGETWDGVKDNLYLIPDDDTSTKELRESYFEMFCKIQESEGPVDDASRAVAQNNATEFWKTWIACIKSENERRRSTRISGIGANLCATDSFLTRVLDRLVETDRALHGFRDKNFVGEGSTIKEDESFLAKHMQTAKRQIGRADGGTSGGGTLYLEFSISHIFHYFPALVHYKHRVPIAKNRES